MIAEIHKIDLDTIFFRISKNPQGKNLDPWVRIQFDNQGITDFTEVNFKFGHVTNFFSYALRRSVYGITKSNVIEMTICFHTVNGVIRIKIEHIFGIITSY